MDAILLTALKILGPILVTALIGLVAQVLKKNGIDMTAAQHDFLVKVATEGINYAEEKAANQTPKGSTTSPITGSSKLALAVQHVQSTIPGTTLEVANAAIHAALPDSGAGATAVDPVSGRPA